MSLYLIIFTEAFETEIFQIYPVLRDLIVGEEVRGIDHDDEREVAESSFSRTSREKTELWCMKDERASPAAVAGDDDDSIGVGWSTECAQKSVAKVSETRSAHGMFREIVSVPSGRSGALPITR